MYVWRRGEEGGKNSEQEEWKGNREEDREASVFSIIFYTSTYGFLQGRFEQSCKIFMIIPIFH